MRKTVENWKTHTEQYILRIIAIVFHKVRFWHLNDVLFTLEMENNIFRIQVLNVVLKPNFVPFSIFL